MLLVVEFLVEPESAIDHDVPDGKPTSEKVIEYVVGGLKAMKTEAFDPSTVTTPEAGIAL
jgi:hypothetical protein